MKKFLCLLLAAFLFLSGTSALAEGVSIAASFYPVYIFAQNILQDIPGVSLSCMTAPSTGCLHDYQLLTGDMRLLSRADALLINGAGMETFLPSVADQLPSLQVIDASQGISLLCADAHHHHDHEHQHEGEEELNAHIWLSPENAIRMVHNLADGLSALLPEYAEAISANAAAYTLRLENAHLQASEALAPYAHREIVTFHDSFPYFAQAFDLHIAAVVSLEPNEPLSPKMLTEVVHTVTSAGNPPLFAEPQFKSAALDAISRETGAPVYLLDPMVTGDGRLTAYEDILLSNVQVLLEAFGN